jgi:glutamine synthetase
MSSSDVLKLIQILEHALHDVGARRNKSASSLPKPLVGDNGSGLNLHQSFAKED